VKYLCANTLVLLTVLTFNLFVGCGRRLPPQQDAEVKNNSQQLPFEQIAAKGKSPTASLLPNSVPAGTQLTVRLAKRLSSSSARGGESFAAVLDQPVVVRGRVLLNRGAAILGKVLAARASSPPERLGYLRLTLLQIELDGGTAQLETSDLFVKGDSPELHHLKARQAGDFTGPTGQLQNWSSAANPVIPRPAGAIPLSLAAHREVKLPPAQRLTFKLIRPISIPE